MERIVNRTAIENNFMEFGVRPLSEDGTGGIKIYAGKIKQNYGDEEIKMIVFAARPINDTEIKILKFVIKPTNEIGQTINKFFDKYDMHFLYENTKLSEKFEKFRTVIVTIPYNEDCYGNITIELYKETVVFEKTPCDKDKYTEAVKYVLDNTEDEDKNTTAKSGYVVVDKKKSDELVNEYIKQHALGISKAVFYRKLKELKKIYSNNGDSRVEYCVKGSKPMTGIAFRLEAETNGEA